MNIVFKIYFTKILIFTFIITLVSCGDKGDNYEAIDKQLSIASELYVSGRNNDAKNILKEVLQKNPENAKANYIYGFIIEGDALGGDGSINNYQLLKEASLYYEKAHKLEPENVRYHMTYTSNLVDIKKYSIAISEYQKIFKNIVDKKKWLKDEAVILSLYNYFVALNSHLDKNEALSEMNSWVIYIEKNEPLLMSQYYYALLYVDQEQAENEIELYIKMYGFSEFIKEEQCNAYYDMEYFHKAKLCFESIPEYPLVSEKLSIYARSMRKKLQYLGSD